MNGMHRAAQGGARFWAEEDGPTITEYAVLLVLIVFGVFSLLTLIGVFLRGTFMDLSNGIPES